MRIVYVAHHGGIHTRRWATFFAERGHDVHVVSCGGASGAIGYRVHDLGAPAGGKAGYLLKLRRARRTIRSLVPDVVHAHYVTSYGLLALVSGVRPLVVTAHGDDLLISPRNPLLRVVVARVLRAATLVTVPSEQMRAAAVRIAGSATPPIDVFQYGVETERLEGLETGKRAARRAAGRPLRIVSARPLLKLYRIDELLRGLAVLAAREVAFSCTIAGDGPERGALKRLTIALGLEGQVELVGALSPAETEALLAQADIAVSIAESDGASIALLEALALGCVPVVSDIAANGEWVTDGVNGSVVRIEATAIAAGIQRAAELDAAAVAAHNRALVRERADRARNLGGLERRLVALVEESSPVRDVSLA